MDRTLTFIAIPVIALVVGGVVQMSRPLPPARIQTAPGQIKLPGAFSVTFPTSGQAAIGEEGLGLVAQTPNERPVAIASLTKMMTAYLLLQAQPLKIGTDGPTTTLTGADVLEYQRDKASGDSVVKVSAGEKLTERQLLEGLLLPSGDNIAALIADQVAGSEPGFVRKMNQAARALGMSRTTYSDASGVSAATISTAHDQILMAQAAMRDRAFRHVVRMPQARLPVAGIVYNVDFMVGKQGITGIKTGSTLEAGSCFVGSYPIAVPGAPRILLGAVLGQQSLKIALTQDTSMLHAVAPEFNNYQVPAPASGFAQIATAWNQQSTLDLDKPLQVFGYPGMPVNLAVKPSKLELPIQAGQDVATMTVMTGNLLQDLGLRAAQSVQDPGVLWRLYR